MNKADAIKTALPIFSLALLFIISAYFAQTYEAYLADLIGRYGMLGILVYMLLAAVAIILAPLSFLPLMPLASAIWGAFVTAIASIIGWTLGAIGAFYLSRRYGRPLVERFVSTERLARLEKRVPQKNLFWAIVLLRMIVPVDVLSYVLGLSKSIPWKVYVLATLIGIIPFAFVFAYIGTLPLP